MRWNEPLRLAVLCLALTAAGCQTERNGVEVDLSAAVRAYRARLDRKPGRGEAQRIIAALGPEQLNDLGVMYEREGRLDDAAWAYQQAIWKDYRFATAYVNLGNVVRKQGKTDEALLRYRQAMNADPSSFEAANNFADLCAGEGVHLDEAIERLTPLVARAGPHQAYGLDTLGWLHHVSGDDEQAARVLEQALAQASEEDSALRLAVHEHLAAVCEALGRHEDAAWHRAQHERIRASTAREDAAGPAAE